LSLAQAAEAPPGKSSSIVAELDKPVQKTGKNSQNNLTH
jgi:hypothetical protein